MAASISKSAAAAAAISGGGGGVGGFHGSRVALKPNELTMVKSDNRRHHSHRVRGSSRRHILQQIGYLPNPGLPRYKYNYQAPYYSFPEDKIEDDSRLRPGSLWELFNPRKILIMVSLQDEDGLIKDKFDSIVTNNSDPKHLLDGCMDCLLENVDNILTSASLVCYSGLQVLGNISKLEKHIECFNKNKLADDDINCLQVLFCVSTYDEISDVNINTLQDFKAFLQKLRSIKQNRLVVAKPYLCEKSYINRVLNSSKCYSHLSVEVQTNPIANIMELGAQFMGSLFPRSAKVKS